ncbi:hypothetical protein V8017_19390 [Stenotrophomonas rhizophila]
MTRRTRFLLLPALLLALPVAHAAVSDPTLAQAQAAMDRLFDEAIADRPASDSSRLVAEAFRPRLQAVSGCLPVTDAGPPSMDCIVTAEDGGDAVHRLLRFSQVDGTGRCCTPSSSVIGRHRCRPRRACRYCCAKGLLRGWRASRMPARARI